MKISDLCESERPREKMLSMGPSALGNSELLAILLRTGTAQESALELSQKLLRLCEGRLSELFNLSSDALVGLQGIGPCKAATVQAALELGRRFLLEESALDKNPIVSARMVFDAMIPLLKGVRQEECWVLFLNGSNYLLGKERVSIGDCRSTQIDISRIVRRALEKKAPALILVHNHPTGNPHPSKADADLTERLHSACNSLQIELLDHVIVSDDCFFSCADEKLYRR